MTTRAIVGAGLAAIVALAAAPAGAGAHAIVRPAGDVITFTSPRRRRRTRSRSVPPARCAGGTDTVDADTLDETDADCEAVTRTQTTAPVPAAPTDRAAPRVGVDAPARQRISRTRSIRVFARSTETGFAAASATLNVAGRRCR